MRRWTLVAALGALACSGDPDGGGEEADAPARLTVLHTNDWQSHLTGFGPASEYTADVTGDDAAVAPVLTELGVDGVPTVRVLDRDGQQLVVESVSQGIQFHGQSDGIDGLHRKHTDQHRGDLLQVPITLAEVGRRIDFTKKEFGRHPIASLGAQV